MAITDGSGYLAGEMSFRDTRQLSSLNWDDDEDDVSNLKTLPA